MSNLKELEKAVISMASLVVDSPQALLIFVEEKPDKILIVLSTSKPNEFGQLIGEQGVMAYAFRILLRAISKRLGMPKVYLVVSPEISSNLNPG